MPLGLLGGQTRQRLLRNQVSDTALRIVAGMKRDWIQASIRLLHSLPPFPHKKICAEVV